MKTKIIKGYYLLLQKSFGRWSPCPLHNPRVYKFKKMADNEMFGMEESRKVVKIHITYKT